MNDSMGRILIFFGALISTLLLVLIIVLLTSDGSDPAPAAAAGSSSTSAAAGGSSSTTAASTTTPGAPTTTAAATTAPPTTAAPTTTATIVEYLQPEGYGSVTAGTDYNVLVGAGDLTFDGWDATGPIDGYYCGWGSGAGSYAGRLGVQIFDEGVGVIIVDDPTITTVEGLGLGSSESDIIAALGAPTREGPGHYVATEYEMYYEYAPYGFHFHFETRGTPATGVKAGFYDRIQLVEGCL